MPREDTSVLVVEDDLEIQTALAELFGREGIGVVCASNGIEAIERLEGGLRPCCVLVDLLMPGIVGQELLDYMGDEAHGATPVAIITGSPHLAPAGYRMFVKPLDTKALLDFVTNECPVP